MRRVEKWETGFGFSTFPGGARLGGGNVKIPPVLRDFQGAVGSVENLGLVFHASHGAGISTALPAPLSERRRKWRLNFALPQQPRLGGVHLACAFGVAHCQRLSFQLRQPQTRFEILLGPLQRFQFFERRPVIFDLVLALAFATLVQAHGRKAAGPVKIQIQIQVLRIKLPDPLGMLAGDVSLADQLADYCPVLAFHQRVVLTAAGPALGKLCVQLAQHFRHAMIDILRAVVDVKPQDREGKLR